MTTRTGSGRAAVRLARTPALDRLEWILDALAGTELTDAEVTDVMSSVFLDRVAAPVHVERMRARAVKHAPITMLGIDIGEYNARATIRTRAGTSLVVGCVVDPDAPHRITNTWVLDEIPTFLAPRLPMDFGLPGSRGEHSEARLIVMSGVPGTGKSTLADEIAKALRVPTFAADWLLGALTPFGGYHLPNMLDAADEMLTTLAVRQLALGQSAILDFPTERIATRERWRSLAGAYGAGMRVIVCVCSDDATHRERAEQRRRAIPGWHDAADWANIEKRRDQFPPWHGDTLTIDAVNPVDENLRRALEYIRRPG